MYLLEVALKASAKWKCTLGSAKSSENLGIAMSGYLTRLSYDYLIPFPPPKKKVQGRFDSTLFILLFSFEDDQRPPEGGPH